MRSVIIFYFIFIIFELGAQNIMIESEWKPEEPSIMFDPKNPAIMVAGNNLHRYHYSVDSGYTWKHNGLVSEYGVWGDPTIVVDTLGHFYFFHLSNPSSGNWIDRIVCQKSDDGGKTWNSGSFAGLNGTKAQDKQWCVVDRHTNILYLTWTQFDDYGSTKMGDSSLIMFSKSLDGGITWSDAKRISNKGGDCIDDDNTVEGAVPTVGPNGEVYVSWAGPEGLVFNRSIDKGENWLKEEIFIDSFPGGWAYDIPGISRCNGLPITACDTSGGKNHGTIYVNWSDQRNGTHNTDVWLSKSTDGGNTWTKATKVNNDTTERQQFLTWMSVDQVTGYLYFVFYDRRNYPNNYTDVYVAVSMDGGETFINKRISESPFLPVESVFFGDYNNIVAYNGIIRPIWTRLHNGKLSIYTDITRLENILNSQSDKQSELVDESFITYPVPVTAEAYVSYKLHEKSLVSIDLYDTQGRKIADVMFPTQRDYGKYVETIDMAKYNLDSGAYLLQLNINNNKRKVQKIIVQ